MKSMKKHTIIRWPLAPLVWAAGCFGSPDAPPLGTETGVSTTSEADSTTSSSPSGTSIDPDAGSTTSIDPDTGSTTSIDPDTSGDSTSTTSTGDTDTTTGSLPSCNESSLAELPFAPPIPLPGVNTASHETHAWMSPDELVLWLDSDRPGGLGNNDIYRSTRDDVTAAFGPVTPLAELNTAAQEQLHSLSSDTLVLYGASDGTGSMGYLDVMVATRPNMLSAFSPLGSLANVNSGAGDTEPTLSADGTELYFASNRVSGWDLYRAELGGGGSFGAPTAVAELNVPGPGGDAGDGSPVLSSDGLTIYLASTRDEPNWDVYVATRATVDDPWSPPANVADVNSGATDLPVWISSDGCRLLLTSTRPGLGGYDLWIAEREP